MRFEPTHLSGTGLDGDLVELLMHEHESEVLPVLRRLWSYYRNEMTDNELPGRVGRKYRLAQEEGLPARLTGLNTDGSVAFRGQPQREIVIENDIAWRVHTLVDFMFGKAVGLQSCAVDPEQARLIEAFLRKVFECNGGMGFFQDLALLGAVYGYVDVLVRVLPGRGADGRGTDESVLMGEASRFVLEIVESPRAIPVLNPDDYRRLDAYIVHFKQLLNEVESEGFWGHLRSRWSGGRSRCGTRTEAECVEIWTERAVVKLRSRGEGWGLVGESVNRLGRVPVVHIQNLPQPFYYEGLSEVEPLIPLQDELNTRLSDRANRVTFQSFKMYLGKGIEQFTERPIGPGQMWATDNPEASIEEFGGDAANPSEDAHINEIREAMDKTSGVTPLAAGLLRNRVGNLTSENALRVTLMGLLARTEKKRLTYGAGIASLCELVLHAADVHGVLANRPEDRGVRLNWPSPLPENEGQRLKEAQLKLGLGVPQKQVLAELGYGGCVG